MGYKAKTFQYSRVEPQDDRTIYGTFLKYLTEAGNGSVLNNDDSFAITDIGYSTSELNFTIQPCKIFVKGGYVIIDSETTIELPPSSTNKVICMIDTKQQNIPDVETRTDSNKDTFTVITGTQVENQVTFTSTTLDLVEEDINVVQGTCEVLLYTVVTSASGISSVTRNIKNFESDVLSAKVTAKKLKDGVIVPKEAGNASALGNKAPSEYVQTTGTQTVAGVKTFSSLPISSATPTASNQFTTKKYVDEQTASIDTDAFVKTTGAQTVAGVKTFSSLPVSSGTPTANTQLVNKSYVDTLVNSLSLSAVKSIQRGRHGVCRGMEVLNRGGT